jgi:hypothetical protein
MAWLDNTQGLIEPDEGRQLARLAAIVDDDLAIVEIGSHTGLSSCWLAAGSRSGNGAQVFCIDPWGEPRPGSLDDPWNLGANGVLERFKENILGTTQWTERESYWDLVTPLRTTSSQAARMWIKPVGLLFVDAIHEELPVLTDWESWKRHLVAPGGWVAFHDFDDSYPGCKRAIEKIAADEDWRNIYVTGSLWTAQLP